MTPLSTQAHQALRTLPALRGLAKADREKVAELFREEHLPQGSVVFREGDPGTALYLIATGAVDVRAGGREVARLGAGEWFGEMALITGAPRSATVEVVLDCRLLVLEREAFRELLAIQPRLYEELAGILSRRLAVTSRGEGARRAHNIVAVENRAAWPERAAVVRSLAASLERELGSPVAIVSVATHPPSELASPREGRPDLVLTAAEPEHHALRERLVQHLAELAERVPITLVELDEQLGSAAQELLSLADTVLVLADGRAVAAPHDAGRRFLSLHDRRRGPVPPCSGLPCVVLPAAPERRVRAFDRLARCLARRTVGLALGSGAAFGLAHVGVLEVLDEASIPVDFIAGASIGSIVGAGYALGLEAAELRAMFARFGDPASLLRMVPSLLGLGLDFNLLRPGMFSGAAFHDFVESLFPFRTPTFADLEIPFRAVAADVVTGARVEIGEGTLGDAMRASTSAPWIFSPFRLGDRLLIDGGMADPVPSETVRSMGADLVIAVNVVPPPDPHVDDPARLPSALHRLNPLSYFQPHPAQPSSFQVVMRTLLIMQHELGNSRAGEADLFIHPPLEGHSFLDFFSAATIIEKGAAGTRAALPAIKQALAEHAARRRGPGQVAALPG